MNRSSLPATGALAGLAAGTWRIDPARTSAAFSLRHLTVRVRGRFRDVDGRLAIGDTLASCSVTASIATASVDTGRRMRDDDLRSAAFLDSANFPSMAFASTGITAEETRFTLTGDLTIRGVTHRVVLEGEFLGLDQTGPQGKPRAWFSGRTVLRRSAFHVGDSPVKGNRAVVGDAVTVELDIEAFLER
jgi:polyisoprenoid-binding protein YceI